MTDKEKIQLAIVALTAAIFIFGFQGGLHNEKRLQKACMDGAVQREQIFCQRKDRGWMWAPRRP